MFFKGFTFAFNVRGVPSRSIIYDQWTMTLVGVISGEIITSFDGRAWLNYF